MAVFAFFLRGLCVNLVYSTVTGFFNSFFTRPPKPVGV